MTGGVDYDEVAGTYQEGRALSEPLIDRWWTAAEALVPATRPLVVLDLGAGTGIFTRAWARWCDCFVVALEPSDGMRSEARRSGLPQRTALVAGTGESLSLRDHSVHVAWLSTVLHHLHDRRRCVEELHRTAVAGGVVFVRGFFSDRGEVGWLPFFPGAERATATVPSAAVTAALFEECGFDPVAALEVDGECETASETAKWVRRMRYADSLLRTFSDEDFEAGLSALEVGPPDLQLPNRLTLLAFVNRN